MSGLRVYAAISAITAELARCGIAKSQIHEAEQYAYRGIDDVMGALAPLLAKHRLCVLPRVLERTSCDRASAEGEPAVSVAIKVAFDIVSARDASSHTIEAYGEALDSGDKGTSKAMSSAYKSAMIQAFCIPVRGSDEVDAGANRPKISTEEQPDPDQGWDQWARDIEDMVRVCEATEAIDRVQNTYRGMLRAASKRRPELYAAIGAAVQARRLALKPAANRHLAQLPAAKSRTKRDAAREVLVDA